MAEAKKTTKKTPVAADKRKAADDQLEARIAARKQATTPKVETTPVTITEGEALPFVSNVPKAEKPAKEKKVAKPRETKPKTGEMPSANVSDLVAKIEAKVSAKLEKAHKKQLAELAKAHTAEIKQLKAGWNEDRKNLVSKDYLVDQTEKAYAAGVKAGEKAANKAITAALKGR